MINKGVITLKDLVIDIFKRRGIELEDDSDLYYWKDYEGYGNPEPVSITDLSNGIVDGEYSIDAKIAQISGIDEVPFTISDFFVVANLKGGKWYGITYYSTSFDEEYSPHPGQTSEEYFKKRRENINERIKNALDLLTQKAEYHGFNRV